MMEIQENIVLSSYTTFKIGGPAKYFCVAENLEDLSLVKEFANAKDLGNVFVLGGGSNVLVSDEGYDGLAVKIDFKGIKVISEDGQAVSLQVAAGEEWDKFVEMAVKNGWWGIENLSHIPGKAGAVVVQNVGAYGQEASQTVEKVEVFDLQNGKVRQFGNLECKFGYRSSIFNNQEKGRYIITSVTFKLLKNGQPNLLYRDLKEYFKNSAPGLVEIRKAVTEIRDKKFPYPKEAVNGNAGSFFKNIILDKETYGCVENIICKKFGGETLDKLKSKVFQDGDNVKIPTAFLLDICNLKNIQSGGARINANQPLVIINATGSAKAADVIDLIALVRKIVFEKCGLKLEVEPELAGFSTEELAIVKN